MVTELQTAIIFQRIAIAITIIIICLCKMVTEVMHIATITITGTEEIQIITSIKIEIIIQTLCGYLITTTIITTLI